MTRCLIIDTARENLGGGAKELKRGGVWVAHHPIVIVDATEGNSLTQMTAGGD
jgi:hypothetical protein